MNEAQHPTGDANGSEGGVRVLVVDDDEAIRTSLDRALRLGGFTVETVASGEDALVAVSARAPDVIVLDVTMDGISGVEVCQRLRADGREVPICILSARDEIDDRVAGLRAGADDYLVKPFAVAELEARLVALLRRRVPPGALPLTVADLTVDTGRRRASRAGRDLDLTRREFDLLAVLAQNHGIVLSRIRLLELVWGYDFEVETNVVDVFVGYLRRKLEDGDRPRLIHTVRGVGFVLRP
ncbi:MAG: response regulator transcription factor [Actinomycetota bacterium]|nr:response regulator transcription factor [Actinomycetota bacterium]